MEWQDVCSLVNSLLDEADITALTVSDKDGLILALLRFFEALPEGVRTQITLEIKRFAFCPTTEDMFNWTLIGEARNSERQATGGL